MAPSRRPPFALFAVAAAVLALDALSKSLVESRIAEGESVELIPRILYLTHTTNTGGAFGLSTGTPWLFGIVAALVAVFIVRHAGHLESMWRTVAFGLILGGAVGNLASRLSGGIDLSGRVVDFIDVRIWPVFNLADSAVVVGAVMLALSYARGTDERAA